MPPYYIIHNCQKQSTVASEIIKQTSFKIRIHTPAQCKKLSACQYQ